MIDKVNLFKRSLDRFERSKKKAALYLAYQELEEQLGCNNIDTKRAHELIFDTAVSFALRAVALISRWRGLQSPQVHVTGVTSDGVLVNDELELELTIRNEKAKTYLPRRLWQIWGERAGWVKAVSIDATKAHIIARGELELEAAPIKSRYEKLMALAGVVIDLAEDGWLGEAFETCSETCDCVVCDFRALLKT